MDFFILLLTGRLMKLTYRLWRLLLGSVLGSLGATLLLYAHDLPLLVEFIFSYVVLAVAMVLVSFGRYKLNRLLFISLGLYGQTIFIGGVFHFIMGMPSVKKFIDSLLDLGSNYNISLVAMIIIMLIILILSPTVFCYINKIRRRLLTIFKVQLSLEGKSIAVKGLLDTGNHLREPISNKPVIIVEQKVIDKILTKDILEYSTRIKIIPYRSIGKDSGTMCGIVLDELLVEVNEEQHIYKNVVACLYKGTLSGKQDYQVILHEELI